MRRVTPSPGLPAPACRLSHAPTCSIGGRSFADTPSLNGASARVIWDPLQFPHMTHLMAVEAGSVPGAGLFRLADLPIERLVVHHAGMQIVLMTQSERALQLNAHGADLAAPVHLFADVASAPPAQAERALVFAAINDLQTLRRFRSGRFPAEPRGARLRMILQALDGSLAGASHRDIAVEIFDPDRVTETWRDPRSHLRDFVRRAIFRGRMLMTGGYRQFVSSA
jgi:hypothetical protein